MRQLREGSFYPLVLVWLATAPPVLRAQEGAPASFGIFESHNDVGTVLHPGSTAFDAASKTYTLSGSGDNMWFASDNFQFAWKKVSGDVSVAAAVALLGSGGDNHRKAVLMIRQSLDPDSPYADAALHGDGLTSLQFRETKGAPTHEVEANVSGPKRLRILKHGDSFYLFSAPDSASDLAFAGGSAKVRLESPFYVGIGVCAHNQDNTQQASFSDVEISAAAPTPQDVKSFSTLQTVIVASTDARVALVAADHLEFPSWSQDGSSILFMDAGKLQQIPAAGGEAKAAEGDTPEAYGQERSPDGRYIYMSSTRTGTAQVWRTAADGTEPEQLTHDGRNNAQPHVSPDGQSIVFLSYPSNLIMLPPNTDLSLRVLSLKDHTLRTIAKFTGGPASLSSHPWSPDGKRLTFISYQSIAP